MFDVTSTFLNQIGLVLGFVSAVLLWFSSPVGTISKDGTLIFVGLDPLELPERNAQRVRTSHWRNRNFTPFGWGTLAVSFLLQLLATVC